MRVLVPADLMQPDTSSPVYQADAQMFKLEVPVPGLDDLPQDWKNLVQVNAIVYTPLCKLGGPNLAVGVGSSVLLYSSPDSRQSNFRCFELTHPQTTFLLLAETFQYNFRIHPFIERHRAYPLHEAPLALPEEVCSVHFVDGGSAILATFLEEGIRCYDLDTRQERWSMKPNHFRM